MPGVTVLSSGASLVWTPPEDGNGALTIATVRAFDGAVTSATAVPITLQVAPVDDPVDGNPWIKSAVVDISGVVPKWVKKVRADGKLLTPVNGLFRAVVKLPPGVRHGQILVQGLRADGSVGMERHVGIDLDGRPIPTSAPQ